MTNKPEATGRIEPGPRCLFLPVGPGVATATGTRSWARDAAERGITGTPWEAGRGTLR